MTEPSLTEDPFAATTDTVFRLLGTSTNGLTNDQAQERLTRFGANRLRSKERATGPMLLLRQFTSPIILILIGAAVLSIFLQDVTDAVIILVIVIVSGLLGFWQEHRAATAVLSIAATFLVPYLPFAPLLGFEPMPGRFYPIIVLIVIAYMAAAEVTKHLFYRASASYAK